MKRATKIVSLLFAALLGLSMTACNTIEGVGKDIKKGGEVIEKTAEKTAEKMKK